MCKQRSIIYSGDANKRIAEETSNVTTAAIFLYHHLPKNAYGLTSADSLQLILQISNKKAQKRCHFPKMNTEVANPTKSKLTSCLYPKLNCAFETLKSAEFANSFNISLSPFSIAFEFHHENHIHYHSEAIFYPRFKDYPNAFNTCPTNNSPNAYINLKQSPFILIIIIIFFFVFLNGRLAFIHLTIFPSLICTSLVL